MLEITKIPLENEMDLILANRRAMKLAELAGFSVSGQTTFATAVSEISRSAIEYGSNASVSLNIGSLRSRYKELIATISDTAVNFLKTLSWYFWSKPIPLSENTSSTLSPSSWLSTEISGGTFFRVYFMELPIRL